jgi:hypothetical protein
MTSQEVTIQNNLDVALTSVKLVAKDKVFELGEVPPQQSKTFSRRGLRETSLQSYVQTHGVGFIGAVNSRQRAFGDNEHSLLNDFTNAAVAASFVSNLNTQNNYENFNAESDFELSPLLERGDAVVLAWTPNHSLIKPLNQFAARRSHRDTLLRLAVPIQK